MGEASPDQERLHPAEEQTLELKKMVTAAINRLLGALSYGQLNLQTRREVAKIIGETMFPIRDLLTMELTHYRDAVITTEELQKTNEEIAEQLDALRPEIKYILSL